MTKRIIIKLGDVFCISINGQYNAYFQYIANDATQLNSSVIRVFKIHYKIDMSPTIDEIVNGEIDFYAHAILRVGIKQGLWNKIGNSKDLGCIENVGFKMLYDSKDTKWYVWKINEPIIYHRELPKECKDYNWGWVYAGVNIIQKIKDGYYYVLKEECTRDTR